MNWYCVFSKPREERAAEQYFQDRLGLETYFPQLRKEPKTVGPVGRLCGPLFPRYLFCRLELAEHYRAVRYAPHVSDLVRFSERPTVVDDVIVAELKHWAGDVLDAARLAPRFQPGDRVEIVDGPLRGLQAIFQQELSDRERVAVLLWTLNAQPRVLLNRAQLAAVA